MNMQEMVAQRQLHLQNAANAKREAEELTYYITQNFIKDGRTDLFTINWGKVNKEFGLPTHAKKKVRAA